MNIKKLLHEMAKVMDMSVDTLGAFPENAVLENLENWDSLAIVSLIAIIDEHWHIHIKGADIESCKTIGDLSGLIQHRLQENRYANLH